MKLSRLFVVALLCLGFASFSVAAADKPLGAEPGESLTLARPVALGVANRPQANQTALLFIEESEPNDTAATADVLSGPPAVARGNIYPNGDTDFFSFTATAGDRVYAALNTAFSPGSQDTIMRLLAPDGVTVIEEDDDDGSLGNFSSSIAGATIPASGTYYLRVVCFSATNSIRPYQLFLKLQSGLPTAESENNDPGTGGTPNPMPGNGYVSGVVLTSTDFDYFSMALNAGDTVFLSLDLDPERDGVVFNGTLGLCCFDTTSIPIVDDTSVTSPNSEAFFMTVKDAGTFAAVVTTLAGTSAATQTYQLSATVFPAESAAGCLNLSSSAPAVIPTPGFVDSTIVVPPNTRIGDLNLTISLNHPAPLDLDIALLSPAGNEVSLITDRGAATRPNWDIAIDDDAAIPPLFTALRGMSVSPEANYRLAWFDGEDAGGVWTLRLRDDTAAGGPGTLNSWSLQICPPALSCVPPATETVIFSTDFEAGDAGFTHSGTADEWARGLPTAAPITTCNSGVNCWKTDLTGTYQASSNQTLVSPIINLVGVTGPIHVSWAQRYQMDGASFDSASVLIREVGNPTNSRVLWQWLDATMTDVVGTPATTIQESAGWGLKTYDVSSFANLQVEFVWNLTSDTIIQLAGIAVDDFRVFRCVAVASIIVTPTSITTSESGTDSSFSAVLSQAPVSNVTVDLTGGDLTEGTFSPTQLVFTPADWFQPHTVTVTHVNDDIDDGDITYTIVTEPAQSGDPAYAGQNPSDVMVTNTDDDTRGVTVNPTAGLVTDEGGLTAQFTMVLTSEPTAPVSFSVTSSDSTEGVVTSAPNVTFTSADWDTPQTVTVTGQDDVLADGDIPYQVVTGAGSAGSDYAGFNPADVSLVNNDNDQAGFEFSGTPVTTSEPNVNSSFQMRLRSQPVSTVTVNFSGGDATEGTYLPTSLSWDASDFNTFKTVVVTAVNDDEDDGDITYTIVTDVVTADPNYALVNPADVSVTNLDDDTASISVNPTSGLVTTEAGGTATFTVVLTSQPATNVVVQYVSNDLTEGDATSQTIVGGSPAGQTLTFTNANWNQAKTVTVTGFNDSIDDGDVPYTIVGTVQAGSDPQYAPLDAPDVSVTNTDDDTAGYILNPASGLVTTEAGGAASFTLRLNAQPTADVTIPLASSDITEGTVTQTSLTFTPANYSQPQTVNVVGVDDDIDDGDILWAARTLAATSTDAAYGGFDGPDASVTNIDNDTSGIVVAPNTATTTESGTSDTFDVSLSSQPSSTVTITITGLDTTEGTLSTTTLTFLPGNWDNAQTVTVTGVDDAAQDGDITYTLTLTASSSDADFNGDTATVDVTNQEDGCAGDVTAPVVTAPADVTVNQTVCNGSTSGTTGDSDPALAAFLAGGSAVDDCDPAPTRLAPQVGGVDVTGSTVFPVGTTQVTFRWQDSSGNTGTATANVTVAIYYGDLNEDGNVDASDLVTLANYLVSNVTPGTPPFNAPLDAADVNQTGTVDASDLVTLANYLVGNIACLPTAQVARVDIQGFAFVPAALSVSSGTRVVWTNRDNTFHTVTGGPLDSGSLAQDQSYGYTTQAGDGTINYNCNFHGLMAGSVTVN